MEEPNPMTGVTYENVGAWLSRELPEAAQFVSELNDDAVEDASETSREIYWPSPYTILSDAFFWPVLDRALEIGDCDLVRRCCATIEALLTSGDRSLVEAVEIRVVEHLVLNDARWGKVAQWAGPTLRSYKKSMQ